MLPLQPVHDSIWSPPRPLRAPTQAPPTHRFLPETSLTSRRHLLAPPLFVLRITCDAASAFTVNAIDGIDASFAGSTAAHSEWRTWIFLIHLSKRTDVNLRATK